MNADHTIIAIMGENVSARHEVIPIDKLNFLPDNPRVYATIREMADYKCLTPDEQQVRIYKRLLEEPSVQKLIPEIERDGGLQDPIIVRWDTRKVIEGNSRLAAYRRLRDNNPNEDKWTQIRCLVVPNLTDDQQTRLLGQTHLHGKTEWSPHAKALFCFRWVVEEKHGIPALSRLSGLTRTEISKNVKVVELMQENKDKILSNFSYYNVLVRNRKISSKITNDGPLRDRLLSQIKEVDHTAQDREFTAQRMRDRLPRIIDKPKILRKYVEGDLSLEDAYESARVSGVEQRLRRVRDGLDDIEINDIKPLERGEVKAIEQVVRQIGQRLKRVSKIVDDQLAAKSANSQTGG